MTKPAENKTEKATPSVTNTRKPDNSAPDQREIGGFKDQNLPEPTRYGDWEVKGRCSDF
jgi:hypothetical protein